MCMGSAKQSVPCAGIKNCFKFFKHGSLSCFKYCYMAKDSLSDIAYVQFMLLDHHIFWNCSVLVELFLWEKILLFTSNQFVSCL